MPEELPSLTPPPPPPTPEELVEQMDALLAQGRETIAKVEQFYADHGLELGIGEKKLLGDEVSERDRVIFGRLLAEIQMIDQRIDQFDPNKSKSNSPSLGARAVGNRYRI